MRNHNAHARGDTVFIAGPFHPDFFSRQPTRMMIEVKATDLLAELIDPANQTIARAPARIRPFSEIRGN